MECKLKSSVLKNWELKTSELKTSELKTSDILLIAWLFFASFTASVYLTKGIIAFMGEGTLAVLLGTLAMHICFLAYAFALNAYYKLELFKPVLGLGDLLKKASLYFCVGACLVMCVNALINIVAIAFDYKLEAQAAIELWKSTNGLLEKSLAFVPTVILAPIAEELIFRGLFYRILRSRTSLVVAMLLSSLIFSLIHFSIVAFIPLTLFAILLCYIYEKFGDLRLCILVHSFFNLFNVSLLILLSRSGI